MPPREVQRLFGSFTEFNQMMFVAYFVGKVPL